MALQRQYKTGEEKDLLDNPVSPLVIKHETNWIFIGICILGFLAGVIGIFYAWHSAASDLEVLLPASVNKILIAEIDKPREKVPAQTVKGLYLTAYSAGSSKKLSQIIKLIDSTELNAVVIDIKDYSGLVLYNSQVPLVKKLKLKSNRLGDVAALIARLHAHNIYVIARQTVFQDPALAEAKPEWALKDNGGGLALRSLGAGGVWRDNKGLSWVDPTRKEVWKYNVDIAREAAGFGFDELNFDYVRFPSDGNMSRVVYTVDGRPKSQIMREFYEYLGNQLADQPVWLSLDMFGLTMEATGTFDMNIGQRIVDAVSSTDYICPMMYPSHYPPGHLGFKNPADHPTEVFAFGLKLGSLKFVNKRAKLRPWIQAFNLGAVYDAAKIRAQIDETEKYTNAGWLLWNASNRYTIAGLMVK